MIATVVFSEKKQSSLKFYGDDLNVFRNILSGEWYVMDGERCVFVARSSEIKYILVVHDSETEGKHED